MFEAVANAVLVIDIGYDKVGTRTHSCEVRDARFAAVHAKYSIVTTKRDFSQRHFSICSAIKPLPKVDPRPTVRLDSFVRSEQYRLTQYRSNPGPFALLRGVGLGGNGITYSMLAAQLLPPQLVDGEIRTRSSSRFEHNYTGWLKVPGIFGKGRSARTSHVEQHADRSQVLDKLRISSSIRNHGEPTSLSFRSSRRADLTFQSWNLSLSITSA